MKTIDATIKKETRYVLIFTVIFSVLMQAVFLIVGKWDYTVLLGNLLSVAAAVGNFFAMCLSIQNALGKDEGDVKKYMRASQSYRMLALVVVAVIGYVVPIFDVIAVVIPLIFPGFAVRLRAILIRNKENGVEN